MRKCTCLLLIVLTVLFECSGSVAVNSVEPHEKITTPHFVTAVKTKRRRFLRTHDMTDESDSEQRTGVGQIVNSVKSWTKNTRLSQLIKSKFISQEAKAKALIQRGATNEALYKEKIIPENVYKALGYEDDMPYTVFLNLDANGKYRFTMRRMKDPEEFRKYQQFQTYEIEWHQAILNKRLPNKK